MIMKMSEKSDKEREIDNEKERKKSENERKEEIY